MARKKGAGGRPSGEKTRAGGRWSEARYRSFIISLLRNGTRRWAPLGDVEKEARTRRGFYRCAGCKEEVPASTKVNGKRVKNYAIDHITPVVDPEVGFEGWEIYIERMYCERDNLQLLCKSCHDDKSTRERNIATERRRREKLEGVQPVRDSGVSETEDLEPTSDSN